MFTNIPKELTEKYLDEVQNSKKIGAEGKKFVEDLIETEEDNEYYYRRRTLFQKKVEEKIKKMGRLSFEDIFPESVQSAMELMLGDDFYKSFVTSSKSIVNYPYTVGYYRKPLRSSNYALHFERLFGLFKTLVRIRLLNLDALKLVKREYEFNKHYNLENGLFISAEINSGNSELIEVLADMLTSENNNQLLRYPIFQAIFMSENKRLLDLAGKLLMAAKLQEGLRQAICETMDCGLYENFVYMFKIVCDNDLLRFSAVKRALATWTGIGEGYADRISKKEIELIKKIVNEPEYADTLLKSKDNVEIFMGLWAKGNIDVDLAVEAMLKIANTGEKHNRMLASYYLDFTQSKKDRIAVSKNMLKLYPDDEKILACFYSVLYPGLYFQIFDILKRGDIILNDYFTDRDEAVRIFEIFEAHLKKMKNKEFTVEPCIFPWYSISVKKTELEDRMFFIAFLLNDDKYRDIMTEYIKFADSYYRGNQIELLYSKPHGKRQKDFVISMLQDRSDASDKAYEIVKNNDLSRDYIEKIEDSLRLKTDNIRKNAIDLIYSLDDEKFLISLENLIKHKDSNRRLGALDLIARAKEQKRLDKKHIPSLTAKT